MTDRIRTPVVHIPLAQLCLCIDCEACFQIGPERCPACTSRSWVLAARRTSELLARLAGGNHADAG